MMPQSPTTMWRENKSPNRHTVERHMTNSFITLWRMLSRFPLISLGFLDLRGNCLIHTVVNQN